jgi:hypothetical protein
MWSWQEPQPVPAAQASPTSSTLRAPQATAERTSVSVTPAQMHTYIRIPFDQVRLCSHRGGWGSKRALRLRCAARRIPPQTRCGAHPRAGPRGRPAPRQRRPFRGAGAPRQEPALGRPARAGRRAGVVGGPQGPADRARHRPARRAHRGPPDRVPGVQRRHPGGRVRRREHDDLGHRHVRDREVEPARGDRAAARAQGAGPLRVHPHRQRLDPAPLRPRARTGAAPPRHPAYGGHPWPAPPRRAVVAAGRVRGAARDRPGRRGQGAAHRRRRQRGRGADAAGARPRGGRHTTPSGRRAHRRGPLDRRSPAPGWPRRRRSAATSC